MNLSLTFVGVLSALAVENLRESYNENQREKEYLRAFQVALQSDTATINNELQRCFIKLNATTRFLELIETADTISSSDFHEATQSILLLIDPAYNIAIYEDLKATGNSRLIRNPELRNSIIAHYTFLNKIIAIQLSSIPDISYNKTFMDRFEYKEFISPEDFPPEKIIQRFKENGESVVYLKRLQKQMVIYRNSLIYSALPSTLELLDKIEVELL